MKPLLDECVPKRLAKDFTGHEVKTVQDLGWKGIKNGELLRKADEEFEVFVTLDQKLPSQQNLQKLSLGILIFKSQSSRLEDLRRLIPAALTVLSQGKFSGVKVVGT